MKEAADLIAGSILDLFSLYHREFLIFSDHDENHQSPGVAIHNLGEKFENLFDIHKHLKRRFGCV